MPAWINIYCTRPLGAVHTADLLSEIRDADLWTLAEWCGIDEELVNPTLEHLRIDAAAGASGFTLIYRPENYRQIEVHRSTAPESIAEELDELEESLEGLAPAIAIRVVPVLSQVREIVAIELGFSQLEEMGVVYAYEIARWCARLGAALIRNNEGEWYSVDDRGAFQLLT